MSNRNAVSVDLFREEMGERIRSAREQRNCGLNDLAREIGMKPSQLSRIETGYQDIGAWWLARIAETLDCTIDELVPLTSSTPSRVAS